MSRSKKSVELADVFLRYGDAYIEKHNASTVQRKVMRNISQCRTALLGGHVSCCDHCNKLEISYNSCRNRHCPKCQTTKQLQWLEDRKAELLPVKYFHVVFTIPHELNGIASYNSAVIYNMLFKAASQTVEILGKDPKRQLGGQMGMQCVLHTWSQNLGTHIHLHCIVPGGALCEGKDQEKIWRPCKGKFLFPVKVMSRLYGKVFVTLLEEAYRDKRLVFKGAIEGLGGVLEFAKLIAELKTRSWNVYAKEPFNGAAGGVEYLARYVSKIAIGNERILSCQDGQVTFKWRDYADHNKKKIMTLHADEFIRRFLSHVLPDGFVRIRSSGFLANACKAKNLELICSLIGEAAQKPKPIAIESAIELIKRMTGVDVLLCKHCKVGRLEIVESIPRAKQSRYYQDTS
jgi:hypothetical protein